MILVSQYHTVSFLDIIWTAIKLRLWAEKTGSKISVGSEPKTSYNMGKMGWIPICR